MNFDPDAYLTGGKPGFDPDAYLANNGGKPVQTAKALARGATAEGVYAAIEGGARLAAVATAGDDDLLREKETLQAQNRRISGVIESPEGSYGNVLTPQDEEQLAANEQRIGEIDRERERRLAGNPAAQYADATATLRQRIREALPVDQAFAQSLQGKVAQGLGQAAGTLPLYVVPGLGPAASVGQTYDEAYQDARQHGADAATAHSAAMKYLPAGALDVLGDRFLFGKILKPLRGKLTVGQVAKDLLAAAGAEGVTEAAQQAYLNQVASRLEAYDPERPFDQEVLDSLLVGALVGGVTTATGQAVTAAGAPRDSARNETLPAASSPAVAGSAMAPASGAKPGAASLELPPAVPAAPINPAPAAAAVAPAAEIPPPALEKYEPQAGLDDQARSVETRFGDLLAADPEGMYEAYRQANTRNGVLRIDVDEIRKLSPDYQADPNAHSVAVHEPASAFSKYVLARALQLQPEGDVVFLAGGGGSGKSTAVRELPDLTKDAAILVDSTLANPTSAAKRVDQVLASGRKVRIDYIYADPESAWRRVEQRRKDSKRRVPLDEFTTAHLKSYVTNSDLRDRYKGDANVRFRFVDNSGAPADIKFVPRQHLLAKVLQRGQISPERAQQITSEIFPHENSTENDRPIPGNQPDLPADDGSGDPAGPGGRGNAGEDVAGGSGEGRAARPGPADGIAPGHRGEGADAVTAGAITSPVVEFPLERIVVNKDVRQFKADADPQTGVVEKLGGKFERSPIIRQILLWEKTSGEHEIITGRHKLDLARRSGEKTIPAQILREADGWTLPKVLAVDAEVNIRGGQGQVKDFAQYFRTNQELTAEQAAAKGLTQRAKGAAGWILGRQATPAVWDLYANNQLTEAKAVAIARGAPGHEAAQASAIRAAAGKTAPELELYARNLARSADRANSSEQLGFSGVAQDFADFEREAAAVAKIQAQRIDEKKQLVLAAEGAARRPEAARKMGLPVNDPAALQARVAQLRQEIEALENPDEGTYQDLREAAGLPRQSAPAAAELETPAAPIEDPNQAGMAFARRRGSDAAEIKRLRDLAKQRALSPDESARLDQLEAANGQDFLGFYNSEQAGLGDVSVERAQAKVATLEEQLAAHEQSAAEIEDAWMHSRLADRDATERRYKASIRKGNEIRAQLLDARGELSRAEEARQVRQASAQAGIEKRLQAPELETQQELTGPAVDKAGQFSLFRRERPASDAAAAHLYATQTAEERAAITAELAQARARWKAEAERIAPGLMTRFGLKFGDPSLLVQQGKVRPEELTGWEQAFYDGHERLLYLFDQALQNNAELFTRLNLLHEMGHAHWDTLPDRRQAELEQLWAREVETRTGPLYDGRKQLRAGVAQGVESDIKEWYAERVAWANHDWARARAAGRDVRQVGPIARAAQELRILLQQLQEWVQQLRGEAVDVDFRRFLDQGDRFERPAPQITMAAGLQVPAITPANGFARRAPGSAHSAPNIGERMRQAVDDMKGFLQRELTSRGHLPAEVFAARVERDGRVGAIAKAMQFALRDLDAAVRAVHGGWAAIPAAAQAQLNDVLGGRAAVAALDPRLQGPVAAMRAHVDELSARLVREGVVKGSLAAKVAGNVGFYLNRSYRKFDDPAWSAKVPPAVLARALSFIRAEMRGDVLDGLADQDWRQARGFNASVPADRQDPAWHQARAVHEANQSIQPDEASVQGLVEYLLTKDVDGPEAFFAPGEGKDLSILTRRKEIAPEIRELLGEYQDPRVNYARSVAKMAQLLETHRFLVQARRAGLGRYFFEQPQPGAAVRIAAEGSRALAPLNGLYTSPEVAEAFHRVLDERAPVNPAWRAYLALNGWTKMAKTVLHPVTQVRNFMANFGFLVANGHWHAGAGGAAVWRAMRAELGSTDQRARAYLARLARYGIVGESAAAGEVREALQQAGVKMTDIEQWTDSLAVRAAKLPVRAAERLYRINDEIFKIYAFENEVRNWREALPAAPLEQIERIAAERVANTLPTYSRVPLAVQRIRRAALLGSFVSFPAEVVRTGYHTVRYAAADLRSNNPSVRAMGARRLAGIIAAVGVFPAASALSRWLNGVDDEDEQDLRRFLPEWTRNSQLLYTAPNQAGRQSVVDLSYLDPWAYLRKPALAALHGQDPGEAIGAAALEAGAPFFGEGVLAKVLLDITRNKDDRGRPVFDSQAGPIDRQLQKLAHVWTALEPGAVTQARRILRAARGEVSASGRAYSLEDEVAAVLTGARSQSIDVSTAHHFQAGKFAGELNQATIGYRRVRDRSGAPAEEIQAARARFDQVRARLLEDLHRDTAAARRLGVGEAQILANLKAAGLSKAEIVTALSGQAFPYLERPLGKYEQLRRQLEAERN